MEFYDIDIPEMEKQRYKSIKATGKYIELNVLIEAEEKDEGNKTSRVPIVRTCLHDCGPTEVACLYVTLQSIIHTLENKYPVECILGKMTMNVEELGITMEDYKED